MKDACRNDTLARHDRRLARDLSDIVLRAAGELIAQLQGVGLNDPADIARRLNRRGFPCYGRKRWTAAAVRATMRDDLHRQDAA